MIKTAVTVDSLLLLLPMPMPMPPVADVLAVARVCQERATNAHVDRANELTRFRDDDDEHSDEKFG